MTNQHAQGIAYKGRRRSISLGLLVLVLLKLVLDVKLHLGEHGAIGIA